MGIGVSTSKSRLAFQELPEIQQFRRKSVRKATNNRLYDGEVYYNPNYNPTTTQSKLSVGSSNSSTPQSPQSPIPASESQQKRHHVLNNSISSDASTNPSEKIGYEVVKLVGRGTFGEVYHVKQTNNGKDLALKILIKPEKLRDLEKIHTEIEIMKSLIHPNILRLLDTFEMKDEKQTDCIVIVSEYCELGSIADYLDAVVMNEKVNFPVWTITGWFVDMIESIKFCSARGVIHRDIKPSNMLIEAVDGRTVIKLADFGLSKALMAKQMASTMCGSPLYAAPEIYNRTGYTSAVDVYSLGVTILELACSYSHDEFSEIVVEEPHRVMELFNSVKLASMKDLIMKMIHPDPKIRIGVNELSDHPLVRAYRFFLQIRAIKGLTSTKAITQFLDSLLGTESKSSSTEDVSSPSLAPQVATQQHKETILANNELTTKEFFNVMLEGVTIVNLHPKMTVLYELVLCLTVLKHQIRQSNKVLLDILSHDDNFLRSMYNVKYSHNSNIELTELVTQTFTEYSKRGDHYRNQLLKILGDLKMDDKSAEKGEDIKQFMKELFKRDNGLKICAQKINMRRKAQTEIKEGVEQTAVTNASTEEIPTETM